MVEVEVVVVVDDVNVNGADDGRDGEAPGQFPVLKYCAHCGREK